MASRFDDILNDCTERLFQGESVEQCLARYPEQAAELEPLLRVAAVARETSSALTPRPEFKARVRHEVQTQLRTGGRRAEQKGTQPLRWMPRWAVAAACTALVFVFAAGGTVAASTGSVPGDTLYPVKTAAEQVQMSLTFSDAAKARLEAKFAKRRVSEMAQLVKKGRTDEVQKLTEEFESHLGEVEQLAVKMSQASPEDEEKIAGLGEVLDRNMARDLAVLDEAEAEAPWQYREAIAVAKFRLMQEYDKAIDALDEIQNRQQTQAGSSGDSEADTPSGETDGSNPDAVDGGPSGSGQQGPLTPMGCDIQAPGAGSR